eukprot:466969-Amphidinium_carterae.1
MYDGRKADLFSLGCLIYEICSWGYPLLLGYFEDIELERSNYLQESASCFDTCFHASCLWFHLPPEHKNYTQSIDNQTHINILFQAGPNLKNANRTNVAKNSTDNTY